MMCGAPDSVVLLLALISCSGRSRLDFELSKALLIFSDNVGQQHGHTLCGVRIHDDPVRQLNRNLALARMPRLVGSEKQSQERQAARRSVELTLLMYRFLRMRDWGLM